MTRLRRLALAAVAALGVSALHTAHAGPVLDRIQAKRVLVEVVSESYPPFSFLNDRNQMDGFDIDVAREFAKRLGVTLKIETPAWEVVAAGAWRGRWDICICSMTPDTQRARVLDFVVPYYDSPAVLVTSASNPATSARDFDGRRIGVQQASSYERYLNHELVIDTSGAARPLVPPFAAVRVAPYENEELAFQDLALGAGKRVDAVLSNEVTARTRMARRPGTFKIVGETLFREPNWIAVDKTGDAQWKAQIADTVRAMQRDGTLARLSQQWFGRDITPR